ncbi:MAG: hypothetical protein HIU84_07490 [Acidobacteria bacterium]|nr:hypothetical protein [Acidobacteriota bacterium]
MSAPSLAKELLRAPAGVALLARLELTQRDNVASFSCPSDCDASAVRRAAAFVKEMPYGEFLAMALWASESWAGPWSGEAPSSLPYLYADAERRREIAEAVAERFHADLLRGADVEAQEWWHEELPDSNYRVTPCFTNYSHVYGNGEFTSAGLWTVTDPPPEVHDTLIFAWDFDGRPTSRWRMPVRSGARLWNINAPTDWVRLVETYPKVAVRAHAGWELPGPNQYPSDTKMLRALVTQHAVRTTITHHALPDWDRVAHDFDGVHLSWAGFLTSEGYISDLTDGGVTMLRYWGSERTLWLNDVFDEPTPLTAPMLTGSIAGAVGVDLTSDAARQSSDASDLETLLGR